MNTLLEAPALRCEPAETGRATALRRYGDFTLAYNAATHPGMQYFTAGGDLADGFLAYRTVGPYAFVLGDPLAGADRLPELVRAFTEEQRKPVFVQVGDRTARALSDLNYFVTDMGPDHRLDLPDYSLSGKPKEWLRYAANWCARRDYTVAEESAADELTPEEVREVSEAWRSTLPLGTHEVTFLNRPLVDEPEPDVRRFVLRDGDGTVQNYVFFDPLYRDERTIGYVTCIKRRRPEAPSLGEAAIMKHAIEAFKEEDREVLRLGLSPLAGDESGGRANNPHRENKLLATTFGFGFRAGWINNKKYALANHAEYKRRFRGAEDRTYYAARTFLNTGAILALTRMMGLRRSLLDFRRPR
ncbi:phosphatidylglycerol lysyltransferase domain-containing protein [Alienimonas californiensis]|uniref:Phosphatidylglycerol lysyltransferase n=1 Tax=Alienimonas californiensis TaxID=2527989 RepID=A0A517P5E1_9PLAN|nr:phosphatidylglycerol lysyltransferase domain-containing protein [Alienimonas californiensis]QDT14576.1 Phosphatidylglycerol lysyltransferase [Alienimonas californiensis]